jgi:hypothetical protein
MLDGIADAVIEGRASSYLDKCEVHAVQDEGVRMNLSKWKTQPPNGHWPCIA